MFALVDQTGNIQVGPRQWLASPFIEFIREEGSNPSDEKIIPRFKEDQDPIIGADFKILPVVDINMPAYDGMFEQLAGPYWTVGDTSITGRYDVVDQTVEAVKNRMKAVLAANRYDFEVSGTDVTVAGQDVRVETDRNSRGIVFQAAILLPEGQTYNFKFPLSGGIFITLSKEQLGQVVQAIAVHVQVAFDWERDTGILIDAAETLDDLRSISLRREIPAPV